jgi:hypothetical protein
MVAHDQHLLEDIAIVREGSKEAFPGRQAAVLSRKIELLAVSINT